MIYKESTSLGRAFFVGLDNFKKQTEFLFVKTDASMYRERS